MKLPAASPRALQFACDTRACAPPPTGTGGSRAGSGKKKGGGDHHPAKPGPSLKVTRTEKAFGPAPRTVKAKVTLKPETEEQCETGDGDCYPAAAKFFLDKTNKFYSRGKSEMDTSTYKLVHGMVTGTGPAAGKRFGHAWVEETDQTGKKWVVDKSNGNDVRIPRAQYYVLGRINPAELQKYDGDQPAVNMIKLKHWGPWD